ncbi:hypothetical protein CHY_1725 [Carboxydothermus hydrogenoformans Z-2901]|uniref:DUF2357 domain-containing protein n=2 Tax=Carboxydothermus hydrogenoformans TaxID=129958 RepID=Q3ABD9_CARHZ|nr:hypothetical protein CHY_1725 [Carboxydothermus hydrogenoformans Z-2901]
MYLEKKEDIDIEIYHISDEIKNSFCQYGKVIVGSFNFSGEVGHTVFKVKSKDKILLMLTIEVFPAKMDYYQDYKAMLQEINEEMAALAYELLGSTFHQATVSQTKHQSNFEFIKILQTVFNNFNRALKRIEKYPKHNIVLQETIKHADKAKVVSSKTSKFLGKKPENLFEDKNGFIAINGKKYLPFKVIELKKNITFDIFENQYVKYILQNLIKRIKKIKGNIAKQNIERKQSNIVNEYLNFLNEVERQITYHLRTFYVNISELNKNKSMTLVFQMAPGYKEVYFYWILLKKGLSISEDIYNITPKRIWKLYEIWCYLTIHKIIKELGYQVKDYGIIKVTDNGLVFNLLQNDTSVMKYVNENGEEIELFYNKIFTNLPTSDQKPDTVLCLNKKGKINRMYIFDAKYRVEINNEEIGPLEEDINAMHRYRDAIVAEMPETMQFKYKTFGAYIMFPYSDEQKFVNHKFYKSIEKVNIGAFPLLPGSYSLLKEHIKSILEESDIESTSRILSHEAIDDSFIKFKYRNVLIGNVKDKKHLEAYLENKFYHIPVSTLANVRPGIEYIAFYQSAKSFGKDAGIYYYGRIKSFRTYKRNECQELPSTNEELYIRFELEDIENLDPPIQTVDDYGIRTHIYTTYYLLTNAENIHELSLRNYCELELYKELKKLKKEKGYKLRRRQDSFELNGISIEVLKKNCFRVNGKIYNIKPQEISKILELE